MIEKTVFIAPDLYSVLHWYAGPVLTGLALIFLVLDRKLDTQTKILWVLIIALVPNIGPVLSLVVRPLVQKSRDKTNSPD